MLIFGLGNPGPQYAITRHNVGFIVLDLLCEKWELEFLKHGFFSTAVGEKALLIKPQNFMNNSGIVVKKFIDEYRKDFVVICDDADLPLGRVRLRVSGSSGGHNGLASIIESLGHDSFKRLRIGIGKPTEEDLSDYVLSPFTDEELKILAPVFDKVLRGVETFIDGGLLKAQEYLNTK